MSLSSNSLFHFTNKIEKLSNVLSGGFKASYCWEETIAVPMVSFCDVPLSQAKFHLESYGHYAIGLKSSWAIKKKLSPVIYMENNSFLKMKIEQTISKLESETKIENWDKEAIREYNQLYSIFLQILKLSKPYKGTLSRSDVQVQNYKYYNEKEWRYIHKPDEIKVLYRNEYTNFKNLNPIKPHFNEDALEFSANDINYLIVKNENDIPTLLNYLLDFNNLGTPREIKLLSTRILTSRNIKEDF